MFTLHALPNGVDKLIGPYGSRLALVAHHWICPQTTHRLPPEEVGSIVDEVEGAAAAVSSKFHNSYKDKIS